MDRPHQPLTGPPDRAGVRRLLALAALAAAPMLVLAVFFLLPVGGMVARGFWPDGRLDVGGVVEALTRERTLRVLWFTVWSATVATVVTVLLGVPSAYLLHRRSFPGVRVLRAALLVPFVLPTVVVGVAFRQLVSEGGPLGGLGLDGTAPAILAALVFFNVAVVVRAVGVAWQGLDDRPAQAAAALGATPLQVLLSVTLPALRPAIVSAASVVFLFCATAFGVVLTLGGLRYSTVETEIYLLTTQLLDLQAAAALSMLQLVTVLALLALTHRVGRTRGARLGAGAWQRPARRPAVRDLPAVAALAVVGLLVALPVGALVAGACRAGGEWSLANFRALATTGDRGTLAVPVTEALANSLRAAVDATWLAVSLGLLVALVVTRRSHSRAERRTRVALDGLFMLPLGVSAVTLGFGFLVTLDRPPLDLRDSPLLVPVAQALVALPLVVRTLAPVLAGVDDRQRQAAASLGAPPWRVLLAVDLPVVWRPLLAGAGFAFAASLGEFGATSFLARPEAPTLPVVIFRLLGRPGQLNYGMALAASVVLAATVTVVMLAVERLRVRTIGAI